jgi:nucleoside-diphosphate-sugar epimerase
VSLEQNDNSKDGDKPMSKAKEYFGYEARVDFEEGLKKTIEWYKNK